MSKLDIWGKIKVETCGILKASLRSQAGQEEVILSTQGVGGTTMKAFGGVFIGLGGIALRAAGSKIKLQSKVLKWTVMNYKVSSAASN